MYTMYCELIQIGLSPESHQLKLHSAIITTQTLQHMSMQKSLWPSLIHLWKAQSHKSAGVNKSMQVCFNWSAWRRIHGTSPLQAVNIHHSLIHPQLLNLAIYINTTHVSESPHWVIICSPTANALSQTGEPLCERRHRTCVFCTVNVYLICDM